ncbi:hypothetical protein [Prosthecobacter sp.]|uniref:hypothetical protein n=1 Tax=Prosthecobacter sp. TaxID=1965333 RepID=UPI0025EDD71B|nr:hypothetical protein [Prosthecobacter sp.]
MERSAALVRMRQHQRREEIRLRREMDLPIWRDWMFWLGVFLFGAKVSHDGVVISPPAWSLGIIIMIVALDRVSRRRSRAARELEELRKGDGLLPDK